MNLKATGLLALGLLVGSTSALSAEPATAAAETAIAVPPDKVKMLQERAERKRAKSNPARFDKPQEAMTFFVNKRTGPILTRGPRITKGARSLDPKLYQAALAQARKTPFHSTRNGGRIQSAESTLAAAPGGLLATWDPLGPSNQGGRTRQLVIDPTDANIMYAAAVGGGVWKSTDAGASWNQLTDLLLPNIAVVSLAMDPKNPQVLYAGTGEGVFNGDAIRGAGMFKTTDGGATWAPLAATVPPNGVAGDFSYVFNIVVSSRSSQRLYASTRNGLLRSNDGGTTWTKLVNGAPVNGCHDIVMQTKRAVGYVFAACGTFAQATIYRALDSATSSFAPVFSTTNMGRTSLAIAPSNESYVYAMSASNGTGNYRDGLLGVFRSTANGNTGSWTTQVSNTNANKVNTLLLSNPVYGVLADCGFGTTQFFNQGWYDNVIAVDPADPNVVWAGGIDLFRSSDGGANWGVASYWWFEKGVDAQYAHADHHVIKFHPGYDGTTNKTMYVANDGGVFRTDDARAAVGTTTGNVCGTPVAGAVSLDRAQQRLRDDAVLPWLGLPRRRDLLRRHAGQRHLARHHGVVSVDQPDRRRRRLHGGRHQGRRDRRQRRVVHRIHRPVDPALDRRRRVLW